MLRHLCYYHNSSYIHPVFSPGFSEGIGALAGLPAIGGGCGRGMCPLPPKAKLFRNSDCECTKYFVLEYIYITLSFINNKN